MSSLITPCHSAPRPVWNWIQRIVKFLCREQEASVTLDMGGGVTVTVTRTHEANVEACEALLGQHMDASTLRPARAASVLKSRAAFILQPPLGGQTPTRN